MSNVNLEELKKYNENGRIKFVQNKFNVITRSFGNEFLGYLKQNDIKIIPYHMPEIGVLTGKFFEGIENLEESDFRRNFAYWEKDKVLEIVNWVKDEYAPIAKKLGITIGQFSIAWALAQKQVGFVVVGSTNPEYIKINLKSDKIELRKEVFEEVESAYISLENKIQNKYNQSICEFRGLNAKFY